MRRRSSAPRSYHFLLCISALVLSTVVALPGLAQTDSTGRAIPDSTTMEQDLRAGAVTVGVSDLDAEISGQEVSGILRSSRDVFANTAGFNFGAARFRVRGLDGEENAVSVNGILINDLESGYAPWSLWGGLNDVTRWTETRTGISR